MTRSAVFLDLNGTLVLPLKPERLEDLVPIPGALKSVARLTRAGLVCPVITVQSRISKGLFSLSDFHQWFSRFELLAEQHGAALKGPYVCPHRYAEPCACKKPQTLLYEQAISDLQITPTSSFVIGDSPEDVWAATALGARGCLVRTGRAGTPEIAATVAMDAALVAPSIGDIVDWILSRQ